jgi:hypothetical protein
MLFISTGIFDDKLRPQILSVGTTANSPLSNIFSIMKKKNIVSKVFTISLVISFHCILSMFYSNKNSDFLGMTLSCY